MITCPDLQAHWQRVWLRAPGIEDNATRVHWMQCGPLYADLRVPSERPNLNGAKALADLDSASLRDLMRAEGFAGSITLVDDVCTWQRDVNWHGTPDAIDAGHMWFDDAGDLIEDGVHAEYAELWRRAPDRPVRADRVSALGLQGVLVQSDMRFLLGLGHPGAPASAALIAALEAGTQPDSLSDALAAHFASIYVLGHWDGRYGVADLATNPLLEGRPVLERDQTGDFLWHMQGFHGSTSTETLTVIQP